MGLFSPLTLSAPSTLPIHPIPCIFPLWKFGRKATLFWPPLHPCLPRTFLAFEQSCFPGNSCLVQTRTKSHPSNDPEMGQRGRGWGSFVTSCEEGLWGADMNSAFTQLGQKPRSEITTEEGPSSWGRYSTNCTLHLVCLAAPGHVEVWKDPCLPGLSPWPLNCGHSLKAQMPTSWPRARSGFTTTGSPFFLASVQVTKVLTSGAREGRVISVSVPSSLPAHRIWSPIGVYLIPDLIERERVGPVMHMAVRRDGDREGNTRFPGSPSVAPPEAVVGVLPSSSLGLKFGGVEPGFRDLVLPF